MDANQLRQLVLDAGADDVGFIEIERAASGLGQGLHEAAEAVLGGDDRIEGQRMDVAQAARIRGPGDDLEPVLRSR